MIDKKIENLFDEYINNQPLPNEKVILNAKNYMIENKKEQFNYKKLFSFQNLSIFATCCLLIVVSIVSINNLSNNKMISNQTKYSLIDNQMININNVNDISDSIVHFLSNKYNTKEYRLKNESEEIIAYYCNGKINDYDCSLLIELQGYCLEDYSNYKELNIISKKYSTTFYSDNLQKIYFENHNYQYNLLINQKINDFNEIYLKINESFNKNL